MPESVVDVESVKEFETKTGTTRFVLRDTGGNEYTTFRERIGGAAKKLEGSRARIKFHEQQRGEYTNVYLDSIEPAPGGASSSAEDTDPEEAGWQTAVEAAPWLVGDSGDDEVPPDEVFEKLKPFKDRVSQDIREAADDEQHGG
jgi:hypothetical protein